MDFSKFHEYLESLRTRYGLPGYACIAMQDHQVIFRQMYGTKDHARSIPLVGNELFDVYSATKVVTMTAVMQLVEQGKLDLEQEVADFIPEFADTPVLDHYDISAFPYPKPDFHGPVHKRKKPIRLRHLMTMTAGLSYDLDNAFLTPLAKANADTQTIVRAIAKMPLLFEPGEHYRYSLGHDVMAAVVELVSGEKFEDYLQNHIFTPLCLTDMYLHPGPAELPRMMEKFQFRGDGQSLAHFPMENVFRMGNRYDCGGAGLACTVEDYEVFLDALACGGVGRNGARILRPETIDRMRVPQLNKQQELEFGRGKLGYSYGLGVRTLIYPEKSRSPEGEFGWDGAAGAFAMVDPKNHISMFFAPEVMSMPKLYFDVHPVIRDTFYQCLQEDAKA